MLMNDRLLTDTPRYVLLHDTHPLCPNLLPPRAGPDCAAIYGFSGKQPYELFLANSDLPLRPYPLVKRFLRNQIADSRNTLQLVIVDAVGPQETELYAATIETALEAQEKNANQVAISFHLTLDPDLQAYAVEKVWSGFEDTSRSGELRETS